jgi:hypothetical protein
MHVLFSVSLVVGALHLIRFIPRAHQNKFFPPSRSLPRTLYNFSESTNFNHTLP